MVNSPKAPHPTDVEVGVKIKIRRRMIGMSQMKLGEALGVTFQQVQKYEKGLNRVGASRLSMVANALGVPVSYFFTVRGEELALTGGTSPGGELIGFIATDEGQSLNLAFTRISSSSVRKRVVNLVKALADIQGVET
ncbi:helix-turn-helix domain-containing protein [Agrobacterium vitis]|uniref:helix-turn-helix domain-containing protein n=1 Tax=Allorhizobium ampelinum TaxID=3025782 RepID=UPI001F3211CB|nr:helix-turn-helix domain-containing protein [Allorhizobium ampelinum]